MYRIDRTIPGGFHDYLLHLWEGEDLPTFAGRNNPYLFDDKGTADRVAQRLAARFPSTDEIPGVARSQPITYTVVEVSQHAWAQYAVYSYDKWQAQFPDAVPAGCCDKLADAIKHADTVTYKMCVVDTKAESRGFVYTNWDEQDGEGYDEEDEESLGRLPSGFHSVAERRYRGMEGGYADL